MSLINDLGVIAPKQKQEITITFTPEEAKVVIATAVFKFTNAEEAPHLDSLLAMFYQGSFDNKLGIMDSFNLNTEEVETILVGVQADENGKPVCFPLAKLLKAEEVPQYLSPDGKGGYFDPMDQEASEAARENMKTIEEAVVE